MNELPNILFICFQLHIETHADPLKFCHETCLPARCLGSDEAMKDMAASVKVQKARGNVTSTGVVFTHSGTLRQHELRCNWHHLRRAFMLTDAKHPTHTVGS